MTNDINTENEEHRKMLEEQKRENEYQNLEINKLIKREGVKRS